MSLKNDRYTYRVTWSEDDNEYVGLCAEFHSLSWLAKTPEAALKGIRKVVADIVNDMQSTGETIPAPISIKHYSGKFQAHISERSLLSFIVYELSTALFTSKRFHCIID